MASNVHRAATPWVRHLGRITHVCRVRRLNDITPDLRPHSYSNDSHLLPWFPVDTSETPS